MAVMIDGVEAMTEDTVDMIEVMIEDMVEVEGPGDAVVHPLESLDIELLSPVSGPRVDQMLLTMDTGLFALLHQFRTFCFTSPVRV